MQLSSPIQIIYLGDPEKLMGLRGVAQSQFRILETQLVLSGLYQGTRTIRYKSVIIYCQKVYGIRRAYIIPGSQLSRSMRKIIKPEDSIKDPLIWDIVVKGATIEAAVDETQSASFTLNISSHNPTALITWVMASTYLDKGGIPTSTFLGKGNPLIISTLTAIAGEPPKAGIYDVFIIGYAWDITGEYAGSFSGTKVKLTIIPYSSTQPVALPGPDQTVQAPFDNTGTSGIWVDVDGSASYDPDGTVVDWEWEWDDMYGHHKVPGETAALNITGFGVHQVMLTVTDNSERQAIAYTDITIIDTNKAPVVSAQSPVQVFCKQDTTIATFTLDGSATTDPNDGDILTYKWTEGGITRATGAMPSITAPIGTHTYVLTVTDKRGATGTAETTTIVVAYSAAPVANAGTDSHLYITTTPTDTTIIWLDGSTSYDPDGTIIAYNWYLNGTLVGQGAKSSVLVPTGTWIFTLYVTDNTGLISADNVQAFVTFKPAWTLSVLSNEITQTASDYTQVVGFNITAQCSSSYTNIATASWTDEYGTLINTGITLDISLTALGGDSPESTTKSIHCTATDTYGTTRSITFIITANPYLSAAPHAVVTAIDAPIFLIPPEGVLISLDGSNSYSTDDPIVQYDWYWNLDGSGGYDIAALDIHMTGISPTLTASVYGIYRVTLVVTSQAGVTGISQNAIGATLIDSNEAPVTEFGVSSTNPMASVNHTASIICTNLTTDVNEQYGDTVTYAWSLDEGSILSTDTNYTITVPEGIHRITLVATDLRGAVDSNYMDITVAVYEPPDIGPIANAGPDIYGTVSSSPSGTLSFLLDGSASYDPDGSVVAFSWHLNNVQVGSTAKLTINAPVGTQTYTLFVTDNRGVTGADSVVVTVVFKPSWSIYIPSNEVTVTALDYTQVAAFSLTALSTSAYNYIVSTTWFDGGGTVVGTGVTLNIDLTATGGETPASTTKSLRCEATDNYGTTTSYSFIITANPYISSPPHAIVTAADAAIFLIPSEGIMISLNGGGSYSADDPIVLYEWYWNFDGTGEYDITAFDYYATGVSPTLTAHTYGSYYVTLVVTNQAGITGISQNAIGATLIDSNAPPIVIFSVSSTSPMANSSHIAFITCTNLTTDVNEQYGDTLTYAWSLDGGPTLSAEVNYVMAVPEGTHRITLHAADLRNATDSNHIDVTVAVYKPPNTVPVANAGANQAKNYTVSGSYPVFYLNGSGSYDPDGDAITYNWYHGNTLLSHAAAFNWKPGGPGTYTVSLQVVDSSGAVDWDTCVLTVTFSAYWAYKTITQYFSTSASATSDESAYYTDYAAVELSAGIQQFVNTPASAPAGYTYVNSDIKVPIWLQLSGSAKDYSNPLYDITIYGVPGWRFPAVYGQTYDVSYFSKKRVYAETGYIHGSDPFFTNGRYYVLEMRSVAPSTLLHDYSMVGYWGDIPDGDEITQWYTGLDMSGESHFTLICAMYAGFGYVSIEINIGVNYLNSFQTKTHLSRFRRYITS